VFLVILPVIVAGILCDLLGTEGSLVNDTAIFCYSDTTHRQLSGGEGSKQAIELFCVGGLPCQGGHQEQGSGQEDQVTLYLLLIFIAELYACYA
jgi:hypothetical protein